MTAPGPDAAMVTDDATVIERSWREPEHFAVLFDRHAPLIHRYINRRIGRQAADDLVAETFLAAFRKRRGYDLSYADARPWLYGIATNLVAQHRRDELRQFRIRRAALPALNVPGPDEQVTADVAAGAMRGLLTGALAGLAPGERDVLLLIAWERLSYDETAHALDVPVGTVRSRLSRARADQFVYTETREASGGTSRRWLSTEGNRAGLVENSGQRSFRSPPCTVAQAQGASTCAEQAGYLPAMPTDPGKLLAYLVQVGIADPPPGPGAAPGSAWEANDLGKAVDYLMQTTYLLPAQRAALFELMAKTPGYTVVPGARDAIGRTGVAVRWRYEGAPAEIILNPVSYAYLGDRTWPVPGFHGKDADAYDGGALIRMAFVDRAGELP